MRLEFLGLQIEENLCDYKVTGLFVIHLGKKLKSSYDFKTDPGYL